MKTIKHFLLLALPLFFCVYAGAQTGYIYVHLKHINEESSPDYSFTLKNSSGATVSTFSLNDQATSDNIALSGNVLNSYDIGLSHGANGGDGQLWSITGTTPGVTENNGVTGTIYYRSAGSSKWVSTGITGAKYIDGAYVNQCVYVNSSGNVFFYNNGTSIQIYSGANATDVTANGGRIAIATSSTVQLYSASYAAGSAPNTTGATWSSIASTSGTTRIDMNLNATLVALIQVGTNTVYTASTGAHAVTNIGTVGTAIAAWQDIAYDDNDHIYTVSTQSSQNNNIVFSYYSGVWSPEIPTRAMELLTGGAANMVYGVPTQNINYHPGHSMPNEIYSRQTDNLGNLYWIDDERVKSSSSLNGNTYVLAVTPGTYTLTETVASGYDLGRINLYDPSGDTTTSSKYNVNNNTITFVVANNKIVFGEYVNEKLNPQAIQLVCTKQVLQTFDASTSSPIYTTPQFGSGTDGSPLQGTSYHYWADLTNGAYDGQYSLVKSTANWYTNTGLSDHTGNGGYFLLVDASYAQDEFYRQRVTNLVPGLSYTISFYASSITNGSILPNISFGLQDTLGKIVSVSSSGNINSNAWQPFSFTFTATTSRADLFLRNNNIGGEGNDLAIDDIALNPILPTVTTTASKDNICKGSSYTFAVSPSGGLWTSSNTSIATVNPSTGVAIGIGAGSAVLTYTYTNAIGCTVVSNSNLKVSTPGVVKATDKLGGTLCFNQRDSLYATITTPSNPSSPTYTYAWAASPATNAGLSTATIQNTAATPTAQGSYTYTVTATDTAGCTSGGSVTVAVSNNGAPTVSANANSTVVACITTAVSLSGGVSGQLHPTYSYAWSGPGTITPASGSGQSNSSTFSASATGISTGGQYTLSVTDANGCIGTATAATFVAAPLSVTAGTYATALCSNTVDSLYSTATGGTSPITYAWSRTSGTGTVAYSPGASYDTTKVTLSGATSGAAQNFTISVTDAKGCTATATTSFTYKNVTGPTILTANWPIASVCNGSIIYFPASVTAGSGALATYAWSAATPATAGLYHTLSTTTSKDTAKPTIPGTYIFTLNATDVNGCEVSTSSTQTVLQSLTLSVSANTSAFCGGISGSATDQLFAQASGGNGTYIYAWGTPTITGGGSSAYSSAAVYNPTVTISGSTASSTFKYPVTVTDGSGCSGTGSTSILPTSSSPTVVSVTASPTTSCGNTGNTISLTASFSGGSTPYNYAWTPPSNSVVTPANGTTSTSPVTASATAETAQNYSFGFSITDNNNCQASGSTATVVTVNPVPSATAFADKYSMCANPSTTINLTGTVTDSTTGPYAYSWAGSGVVNINNTTTTAVPGASGTYSFNVTDGNGCTGTGIAPAVNVDQATPSISTTCGTNAASVNYVRFYENNGLSWLWTGTTGNRFYTTSAIDVASDSDISHLQAPYVAHLGTYNVAITNNNGCRGSASITLTNTGCATVLALTLLEFTASRNGDNVLLRWTTQAEGGAKTYVIERSNDGITWLTKGIINNIAQVIYSFIDDAPLNGFNYYRLKIVEANGGIDYSTIKMVQFSGIWLVKLYPNPAQSYTALEFNSDKDEDAMILVQTVTGKLVLRKECQITKGFNRIEIDGLAALARETYFITLKTVENIFHGKLIKVN